jgi:hypothetical protein
MSKLILLATLILTHITISESSARSCYVHHPPASSTDLKPGCNNTTVVSSVPAIRPGKIIGELISGSMGSLGCGVFAAYATNRVLVSTKYHDQDSWKYIIAAWIIGSNLGCALAVTTSGSDDKECGSYWSTLGGSVVGAVIGYSIADYQNQHRGSTDWLQKPTRVFWWTTLSEVAGAMISFNLFKRPRTPQTTSALFNVNQSTFTLSPPFLGISNLNHQLLYQVGAVTIKW